MNNPTDTNQASGDIDNILFEVIESAGSYSHKLTAAEADYIQEQAKEVILAIIRTEKLKLLAEVREQAIGRDDSDLNIVFRGRKYDVRVRNSLRSEQRTALTKLEAEL